MILTFILQDLSECLTGPAKEAWTQYRKDAEALTKRFKQEDNSKIQADMDHYSQRWNELHERYVHPICTARNPKTKSSMYS